MVTSRRERLPYSPPFPVMGLGPGFTGKRWLGVTGLSDSDRTSEQTLYEVTLGHGELPGAHWLVVCTDVNREHFPYSGLETAATGGLGVAVSMSDELDVSTPIEIWAKDLSEPTWGRSEVDVEGARFPCWTRQWGDVWVAATDLGNVSVGMCGRGFGLSEVVLESVNDVLDTYE